MALIDSQTRVSAALASRYQLLRELGAGGMATVYLAEDLRHHRKVAIKVLRPELSAVLGGERFLNEIALTAGLQHPHILPLFDSGAADGLLYYVMPFVDGESLRHRLDREQQLPIPDAVRIAAEMADALEYAHRQGVIHRDIKPENILLRDGHALVADFGIALAVEEAGGERITQTGLSVGTPRYMAPEQALGEQNVDQRADIYALGAVTYEMLAGSPPFTGPNAQAILAKVVTATPEPLSALRHRVPEHVEAAVLTALEKLPADRFATAGAFAAALAAPTTGAVVSRGRSQRQRAWSRPWLFAPALAAALVLGGITGTLLTRTRRTAVAATYRVPVNLTVDASSYGPSFALSPDGSQLLYRRSDLGGAALFDRPLDSIATPRAVTSLSRITTEASFAGPRFSPDGRFALYAEHGVLEVVPVSGGASRIVADSVNGWGVWAPDGRIYFQHIRTHGIASVPEGGGPVSFVTSPDSSHGELAHYVDDALPNGKGVLVSVVHGGLELTDVALLDPGARKLVTLVQGSDARVLEAGYLLFSRADHTVWAAAFDLNALKVRGLPVPLLQDVVLRAPGSMELAVSRNGTLLYEQGSGGVGMVVAGRSGPEQTMDPDAGVSGLGSPRVSPDGTKIVYERIAPEGTGLGDLWIYDIAARTRTRLTFSGDNSYPAWSADGRLILFSSRPKGVRSVAENGIIDTVRADGSGQAGALFTTPGSHEEAIASPDGKWVVVRDGDLGRNQNADLFYFPRGDASNVRPFAATPFKERSPAFSPDSRWLAYTSNESGDDEVYVRSFPGPAARLQVSANGGVDPVWARKARTLYYREGSHVMAASLDLGASPRVIARRMVLSDSGYNANSNHAQYDVMPGDTTLVLMRNGNASVQMVLAVNWLNDLKTRVSRGAP